MSDRDQREPSSPSVTPPAPPPSEHTSTPGSPPHPLTAPPPAPSAAPPPRPSGRAPAEIPQEIREEIIQLHGHQYGTRQIAPRVGQSRKLVRRVLREQGLLEHRSRQTKDRSKLDPYRERIASLVQKRLTTTRILRDIKGLGYQGGRSILAQFVRELRTALTSEPRKNVKRRFEPRPARRCRSTGRRTSCRSGAGR